MPPITTEAPTTEAPTTEAPTTEAPTTEAPTTEAPTTEAPTTEAPTTEAPTTEAPTTEAPATEAPTTEAPTTEAPATEPDKEISSKDTEKAMVSAGKKQVSVLPGATADELKALLGGGVTIADKDGNETEPGKKVGTGAIVKTADGAEYPRECRAREMRT